MNLLIDDGVASRGQRKNIVSGDFKYIGAALGPHPTYRHCCVVNFSSEVVGNDMTIRESRLRYRVHGCHLSSLLKVTGHVRRSVKTVPELDELEVKRIIASIPYGGNLMAELRKELEAGGCEVSIVQVLLACDFRDHPFSGHTRLQIR